MAYIALREELPGMRALLDFRPAIAAPLTKLTELLMRSDEGLSMGERELLATFVSFRNNCAACYGIHGEIARCFFDGQPSLVEQVKENFQEAVVSPKFKALLHIAGRVAESGKNVAEEDILAAKHLGASDLEIHDTVLITSLFCLFNRYMDGLGIQSSDSPESLRQRGRYMAEHGYR